MRRQCHLYEVTRLDERMKLLLAADARLSFATHVNKGKKYPYANERQKRRWKLTPEQVAEIRSSPDRVPALAARYSVTESNIRQILLRKTWKFDGYTPIGFAVKPYRRPAQQES